MILVDWYDPGFKAGGQIRSIKNLVESLEDVFEIYVVTSDSDLGDDSLYMDFPKNEWIRKQRHQVIYLTQEKRNLKNFRNLINQIKPDILYLNSMFSPDFTIKPLLSVWRKTESTPKIILAPRGMLQSGAIQFKYFKKRFFLWAMKKFGLRKKIIFHATDVHESADILKYFGKGTVIRQTPDFFASIQPLLHLTAKKKGELDILFVSRITDKKNLHYALQVLADTDPQIKIRFNIIGPVESEAYWSVCKGIIEKMPAHIQVNYLDAVHPTLLQQYYLSSHLFFLPTHGENFGHVIFDALLFGRPVLISDQTPWKNLLENQSGSAIALDQHSAFRDFIHEAASWEQQEFDEWCKNSWNFAGKLLQTTNLKSIYSELFNHG